MAYTDSTILSSVIASTSEQELPSINVPAGLVYSLRSLFGGHDNAGGGTYRLRIDTYTQGNFEYIFNSDSSSFTKGDIKTPVSIDVRGPALIQAFMTCDDATSGTGSIQVEYINSEGATN